MQQCFLFLVISFLILLPGLAHAQVYADIVFPVDGVVSFQDTFGAPRGSDRLHEGIDIIADKHTPVLAAASGRVAFAPEEQPSYGWILVIDGDDGYEYSYIHLNNDNYGTDDGEAPRSLAIADNLTRGDRVVAGQVIGWLGDSGNAEETVDHLHFEMRTPDGEALNAFDTLQAALGRSSYDPGVERDAAETISIDLELDLATGDVPCEAESLVTSVADDAVYYCGRDGKRYAFLNRNIYFSWYDDFDDVVELSVEEMAQIPFGGVVTYRPGVRLVKLQTVPKVYAVARNGVLRWVPSEEVAIEIFGEDWADQVDDLSDAFYPRYDVGEPITTAG